MKNCTWNMAACASPARRAGWPCYVEALAARQPDREDLVKGPSADRAFGPDGVPTPAAIGFARSKGLTPKDLEVRDFEGGKYVVALVKQAGRPAGEVLVESLPGLVAGIKFDKSMRWNASGVAFSRPLRWFVALLGGTVIPFEYAGLTAGRITRGLRPYNSPEILIPTADEYFKIIKKNGILLEVEERKALIAEGVKSWQPRWAAKPSCRMNCWRRWPTWSRSPCRCWEVSRRNSWPCPKMCSSR